MEQVGRPEEKAGALGPTLVGLQCAGRSLADFQRDTQAGVRDGIAFFEDYVLIVRTPPNPGLGTLFKIMTKGTASVVPHSRIPKADITGLSVVQEAPPSWRLIGELDFLKLSTREGDIWHWIDTGSMGDQFDTLMGRLGGYGQ
jgi:hypothetical protein